MKEETTSISEAEKTSCDPAPAAPEKTDREKIRDKAQEIARMIRDGDVALATIFSDNM